jgi:serine/threonine protein kinase
MVAMLDVVVGMIDSPFFLTAFLTFFDILFPAIMYLESKQKLHRDISYTNILLREPGVDSATRTTVRENFIESLGLSDIEKLRKELNCREGLLIDFDYGALIPDITTQVDQFSKDCERGEADERVGEGIDECDDECDDEYQAVMEDVNQASQSIGEETQKPCPASASTPDVHKPADPSGGRTVCFSYL